MGYVLGTQGFSDLVSSLLKDYRIFAPVIKKGAGRFTDVDCVIYDEIRDASEIELEKKSDYSAKEFLLPLSETLLYFTEEEVKDADLCLKPILIFGRSC
ncbi:MAG: anaerobic sulfite reductase subunit A, partial [Solobacterium sp.]|nr:anaerobic sulfite reductase subunit A [Solobacterium sp.]